MIGLRTITYQHLEQMALDNALVLYDAKPIHEPTDKLTYIIAATKQHRVLAGRSIWHIIGAHPNATATPVASNRMFYYTNATPRAAVEEATFTT